MVNYIKLSKIANISTGFPFKGELYSDKGIRVIRGENVTIGSLRWDSVKCWDLDFNQAEKYTLKKGDVVIGMDGSRVGKNRAQIKESDLPLLLAQRVACLRSNKLSDQDFLYYIIRDERFERYVNKTQTGSSIPHISQQQIEDFYVPNHPLENQRRIASVLFALDAKIELNNRINAELEGMAKILYNYWFVQFDFPNAEEKPYKSSGGKMVWNEELKREIPEGWEVKAVREFASTSSGGTPLSTKKEYYENGDIAWINSGELNNLYILYGNNFITEKGLNNSSAKLFSANTILLALYGATAGKVSLLLIPACTNQAICAIIPNSAIYVNFLKFALSDLYLYLINLSSGSARDNLSQEGIKDLKFIIPTKELLVNFDNVISPIIQKISINLNETKRLATLRDWLLPMLMNGQVTVGSVSQPEAEKPALAQPEPLFIADNKKAFAKQVLGGKIVSLFQNDPHFSSIKFQKIQYLAEHVAEVDLNWNYYYQAAGPYDNVYMHTITDKLKTASWFEKRDSKYVPLDKQAQIDRYYQSFFIPVAHRLNHLFSLLANMTDIDAEIIATLYAVWNNRLILKQPVNEALLIEDFYNWSDRKLLYTQEQLQKGLQWMHTNNIIPSGFGKEMKRAKEKGKVSVA